VIERNADTAPAYTMVEVWTIGAVGQAIGPMLPTAVGVAVSPLPIVEVLVSTGLAKRRLGAPAALGRRYVREER